VILAFNGRSLSEAEYRAVERTLDRFVPNVIDAFYRYDINAWSLDADGLALPSLTREAYAFIAERVARAVTDVIPHAAFTISEIIFHSCPLCEHECEEEVTLYPTARAPSPEERAIFKYAMELS
jgi:hypothetical protein